MKKGGASKLATALIFYCKVSPCRRVHFSCAINTSKTLRNCVANVFALDHKNDHLGNVGGVVGNALQ